MKILPYIAFNTFFAFFCLCGFFYNSAQAQKTAEEKPVDGDAIISASIGEPSNLTPGLASDSASSEVIKKIFNGLLKIDENMNIVPDLAESYEVSEDGLSFKFKLRKNVKWHDGEAFTSRDAMFTYKMMSDPKTPTAYAEPFMQVKKAEAPDDYTFIVTYDKPLARAKSSWCSEILPAHILEGQNLDGHPFSRNPIGTGPYKFEKWEAGQRIILRANPDYFLGRPHIEQMVIKIIPDLNTQMMELLVGSIDTMSLTPDQYDEKKHDKSFLKNYNLFNFPSFSYTYLGFNLKDPRFSDLKVRQAIAYTIDKEEIIESVLLGLGREANGPFKPEMWAYNPNIKPYEYDPQKAKDLLAEAGWTDTNGDGIVDKNGQNFEFTIMTNQGNKVREQSALIIQARLKEVGIKANVRIVEWAAFLKEYLHKGNFEAIVMAWSIPIEPDLFDVWHSSKTKPGELNFVGYKDAEVDTLIDKARFTLDQQVRQEAYFRIQEILHQQVPYVFLFIPDALPTISNRFIGPEIKPAGMGFNFNQWYVPLDKQRYKP